MKAGVKSSSSSGKLISRKQRSISLQRFAKAKQSQYDKRKVLEQKRTLQIIRRKKLSKQLQNQTVEVFGQSVPEEQAEDGAPKIQQREQQPSQQLDNLKSSEVAENESNYAINFNKSSKKNKYMKSSVQRLYEKQQKEKQQQELEKQEQQKNLQLLEQQNKERIKQRKNQHVRHMKRNWKGQPIMRYQIEDILQKLEKEKDVQK